MGTNDLKSGSSPLRNACTSVIRRASSKSRLRETRGSKAEHAIHSYNEADAQELMRLAVEGGTGAVRVIRQILRTGLPVDVLLRKALRFRTEIPVTTELSALQIACAKGHAEVVATLAGARADVNLRTGQGLTPLHLALMAPTKRSRRTVCVVLLCCGADPTVADLEFGETPVDAAKRRFGDRAKIAGFLRAPPPPTQLWEEAQQALPGFDFGIAVEAAAAAASFDDDPAGVWRTAVPQRRHVATPRVFDTGPLTARAMKALEARASIANVETVPEATHSAVCGICLDKLSTKRWSRPDGLILEESSEEEDTADDEECEDVCRLQLWQLPCAGRHIFHAACVKPWLRRCGLCPVCRCQLA